MDVKTPQPIRPIDANSFTSITTIPVTSITYDEFGEPTITFGGDLTDAQVRRVQDLVQMSDAEVQIRDAARDLLPQLRQIRDSSGTLSTAQLSNSVRVLSRAVIALGRLALHETDSAN
jgi:hypothetical protein